jgi:uncharacterized phage protein gp47/JayE
MPAYFSKSKDELLRKALKKVADTTPITSTGPGAVARALVEVMTDQLGDYYASLDFNVSQGVVTTASGRSLDLIGQLYNVERKKLADLAAEDQQIGAFYFYLDSPASQDIIIPRGTRVSTDTNSVLGDTFIYGTTEQAVISTGHTRGYCTIRPLFETAIYTAGVGTLTTHGFTGGPLGVTIHCTNPKAIEPVVGFEADEAFRTRLIKSVRVAAGGTEDAIRFAILSIPGIRDVKVREAPYGLGSFEVVLVAEDYTMMIGLTEIVGRAMSKVKPLGVRCIVSQPTLQHVDLKASITVKPEFATNTNGVLRRVNNTILRYLNTLSVGDPLVYNRLVTVILDAVDSITDVTFTRFAVNGQEVLRKNFAPADNEQLVPGDIQVTIS